MPDPRFLLSPLEVTTLAVSAGRAVPTHLQALGLPVPGSADDDLVTHGWQGLAAKGFVSAPAGAPTLDGRAAAVGAIVAERATAIAVTLSTESETIAGRIIGAVLGSAFLQTLPFGVLAVELLDPDIPARELAADVLVEFLGGDGTRHALVEVEHPESTMSGSVWMARVEEGAAAEWKHGRAPGPPEHRAGSLAEMGAALRAFLERA